MTSCSCLKAFASSFIKRLKHNSSLFEKYRAFPTNTFKCLSSLKYQTVEKIYYCLDWVKSVTGKQYKFSGMLLNLDTYFQNTFDMFNLLQWKHLFDRYEHVCLHDRKNGITNEGLISTKYRPSVLERNPLRRIRLTIWEPR